MGDDSVAQSGTRESVILRGWQTKGSAWWGPLGTVVIGFAAGLLLIATSTDRDGDGSNRGLLLAAAVVGALAGIGVVLRYRIKADSMGVSVRWVKEYRTPWTEIVDLRVIESTSGTESVLLLRISSAGRVLCRTNDPGRFIAACRAQRTEWPTSIEAPQPDEQVLKPVMTVSSPWQWSIIVGAFAAFTLLAVVILVSAQLDGWFSWGSAAFYFVCIAAFAVMAVVFSPRTRGAVAADTTELLVIDHSRTTRLPMAGIDGFAEVAPGSSGSARTLLAVFCGEQAIGYPLPPGRGENRSAELVKRLEALRTCPEAESGPLSSDRSDFDPTFRPPWVPPSPVRWLVPAALFLVSVTLLASVPFAIIEGRREAERVRDRSISTVGIVTAVRTTGKENRGLVRYATADGPVTVEFDIEPDESSGDKELDLLYDPERPARVWRADNADHPPDTGNGGMNPVFTFWIPLSLGLALWLRWHPPSFSDDLADRVSR